MRKELNDQRTAGIERSRSLKAQPPAPQRAVAASGRTIVKVPQHLFLAKGVAYIVKSRYNDCVRAPLARTPRLLGQPRDVGSLFCASSVRAGIRGSGMLNSLAARFELLSRIPCSAQYRAPRQLSTCGWC